jgi:hypothetical protein
VGYSEPVFATQVPNEYIAGKRKHKFLKTA